MMDENDIERDLDAAERALGTMPPDPAANRPVEQRMREDAWARRLLPLTEAVPEARVSAGLFDRISARIAAEETARSLVAARRRAALWQAAAAGIAAVAAALLLYVAGPLMDPEAPVERYVAVVTADDDGSAGLIVQIDTGTGLATVIPVGVPVPENRSFEMWHLPVGAERPRSLGLLPDRPEATLAIEAGPGDLFAISVEQPGGSPTGQPTDARFHGRLVPIE